MRFIDLSLTIEPSESEPVPAQIEYISHEAGADLLGRPSGIDRRHFPDGLGLSLEHVRLTSHTGTHVDAPLHYGPICAGQPARAIDQLPLEWFFGPGVLLRCPGRRVDGPVALAEVRAELERSDYTLRPGNIVLIETGADQLWGGPGYFTNFRGVSRAATEWIVEQGVRVIGVDSFGFDPPFEAMLAQYAETGDPSCLWPAHVYGRQREYCQIERLTNLGAIGRPHGFQLSCFPIKLYGGGAGWSRVVAIIHDEQE